MTSKEINESLLASFPELKKEFGEYTSWQDGIDTGSILVVEDVFMKFVCRLFEAGDEENLRKAFEFMEKLSSSGDPYAKNVAEVAFLESLKASEYAKAAEPYLGPNCLVLFKAIKY